MTKKSNEKKGKNITIIIIIIAILAIFMVMVSSGLIGITVLDPQPFNNITLQINITT